MCAVLVSLFALAQFVPRVTGLGPERISDLIRQHDLRLSELTRHRATLEDVYLELTRSVTDHARGA